MSGIINSAGSKSGVIGSTEIPGGYEEGSFVPVYSDAQSAGHTQSGVNWGYAKYTKIGRLVKVAVDIPGISTSGLTSTAVLHIQSLPFIANNTGYGTMQSYRIARDSTNISMGSLIIHATNVVKFPWFTTNSATPGNMMLVSDIISTTSTLTFELTYTV